MRTGKKTPPNRKQKVYKSKKKASQSKLAEVASKTHSLALFVTLPRYIGQPFTRLIIASLRTIKQTIHTCQKISADQLQRIANRSKAKQPTNNKVSKRDKKRQNPYKALPSGNFSGVLKLKHRQKQILQAAKALKKRQRDYVSVYNQHISRFPLARYGWGKTWLQFYDKHFNRIEQLIKKFHHLPSTTGPKLNWLKAKLYRDWLEIVGWAGSLGRWGLSVLSYPLWQGFQLLERGLELSTQTTKSAHKHYHNWENQVKDSWLVKQLINLHYILTTPIRLHFRYVLILTVLTGFTAASYGFYYYILRDLPDASALGQLQPSLTTKIYDRNGILLYKIYKNENRSLVPLQDIPPAMIQATIAVEDQNFYQHPGFSIRGISRALKANLIEEDQLQGGSTITQQLIKNTLLSPERTVERKTKELILSFITEFYYSKDEILAMYLNQVAYGGSAYGVEEAAQMYFGKSIREVDLAEASFLAGLPAAPTTYSPYGSNPEQARARQRHVLRRMVEDGYITPEMSDSAYQTELAILPPKSSLLAPHFVMYVREALAELYGTQMVEKGGLEVVTSLDLGVQNYAQNTVAQEVVNLRNLNVNNGAALITEPKSGEVLAMVGSIDYFSQGRDGQVNVTQRLRQPGSSIKPLTYAMALSRGLTPASVIPDTPICYNIKGQPPYCPKNYDNSYHGNVTIRQALANSYNIPAVKTLAQFSVDDLIDFAETLGITSWQERNRFGLALTLGGGEVRMVDMAVAYGVFANQGMRVPLQPILEVKSTDGSINVEKPCIHDYGCKPTPVLDSRVAYQITDILSDNQARSNAFGLNSVLHIPGQQVAVKTGTTNNMKDNWTFGYTQDRLVAVWVGNNDSSPMSYIASGITGASPIWQKLIASTLDKEAPHQFSPPANLAKVQICSITGQLACNGCPATDEFFIPGTEPKNRCSTDAIARTRNPAPPQPVP